MLFDQRDQERIRIFNDELRSQHRIRLRTTNDPRSLQFLDFAQDFAALAPKLGFSRETSDEALPPAMFVGMNWGYQAIPVSAELDPFLYLLQLIDGSIAARDQVIGT